MKYQFKAIKLIATLAFGVCAYTFTACNPSCHTDKPSCQADLQPITEAEVLAAQQSWSDGLLHIGQVYLSGGDYKRAAQEHVDSIYYYQAGPVLFKPTLASEQQFRTQAEGAYSYFVGGDERWSEDKGFAIKGWSAVRWENAALFHQNGVALAMGNYYFTPLNGGEEVKVEYSFGYVRDQDGRLRVVLHDSHKPYAPH